MTTTAEPGAAIDSLDAPDSYAEAFARAQAERPRRPAATARQTPVGKREATDPPKDVHEYDPPIYLAGEEEQKPETGPQTDQDDQASEGRAGQDGPEAEARAALVKAEADKAAAEAERRRLANRRAEMRLDQDQAEHAVKMAQLAAERLAAEQKAAEQKAAADAARDRAQAEAGAKEKAERQWKWGALGIYIAGAVVSLPLQLLAFYDPHKQFLLMAPVFLEGLALVVSFGAAAAVSSGKAVWPYRVGVMLAAGIAATVNLVHGFSDPRIGIAAGTIGALTSIGGPIVWTAYEHGRAKRLDGVPTRRERIAAERIAARERAVAAMEAERDAVEEKSRAEAKRVEETRKLADKVAAHKAAVEDQRRRDKEREDEHPQVWAVAVARRTATGSPAVTEQIWAAAWEVIHGTKEIGVTAEIRAQLVAARAAMQEAGQGLEKAAKPQVESQTPRRDPDAEDGRKYNGGTPPRRRPGDTPPYAAGVGKVASAQGANRAPRRTVRSGRK
ncbi:hypothetical protein ACIGZJ_31085 [Kitasatospora sp. NPDC052868]|uniref:hypothetical protein n=1 Tax=Kitasatospora sp. NPDC052868 TaxID=3364060 RepID=UPI0037C56D04